MITPEIFEQAAENLRKGSPWKDGIELWDEVEERWRDIPQETVIWINTHYRIKPKIFIVNGREYPEPLRVKPKIRSMYWWILLSQKEGVAEYAWKDDQFDNLMFSRGLIHSTEEAAQQHAAALLGIDVEELRG